MLYYTHFIYNRNDVTQTLNLLTRVTYNLLLNKIMFNHIFTRKHSISHRLSLVQYQMDRIQCNTFTMSLFSRIIFFHLEERSVLICT